MIELDKKKAHVYPFTSLRISPDSIASACSFHREKMMLAVLSATRHFRTTLPSLVVLTLPAGRNKQSRHAFLLALPQPSMVARSRCALNNLRLRADDPRATYIPPCWPRTNYVRPTLNLSTTVSQIVHEREDFASPKATLVLTLVNDYENAGNVFQSWT